jgi:hypothetical protein
LAFCFFCRFFGSNDTGHKGHVDSAFTEKWFNFFKANECLKNHEETTVHLQSISSWNNYDKGKSITVVLLDENKEAHISKQEQIRLENRQLFERFINIVLCLAKGGRPFRGHEKTTSSDKGLFLYIVHLVSKYDPVLKKHLESSPGNATYLSKKIQNKMILSLQNVVIRFCLL